MSSSFPSFSLSRSPYSPSLSCAPLSLFFLTSTHSLFQRHPAQCFSPAKPQREQSYHGLRPWDHESKESVPLFRWFSWVFILSWRNKADYQINSLDFPPLGYYPPLCVPQTGPSSLIHPWQGFQFLPWAPLIPALTPRLHFVILIFNQNLAVILKSTALRKLLIYGDNPACLLTSQIHPVRGAPEIFVQTDRNPPYLAELTSMTRGHTVLPGDISGVMHSEILPGTQSHCHLFVKINSIKCQPS